MAIKQKKNNPILQHPLTGSSFTNLITLIVKSGGVDIKYFIKALSVLIFSLFSIPLRLFETVKFGKKIDNTKIQHPPIFILGHWRSGTTYLHRLIVQDKNLAYISSFQAFLPESSLGTNEILQSHLKKLWPEQRMMDNVTYSPDVPEEEEYALANMVPLSFYNCWVFPKNMRENYKQSVLLDGISKSQRDKFKSAFLKILKKATFIRAGKQLVVKNPANTSRIPLLLEMFPDAKFIHIFRSPYDVYCSSKNFYEKLLPRYQFQNISDEEIRENIFIFYRDLMERYFETVNLIPAENLIEIKYEDFEENELEELKKIYTQLNIPGFEEAKNDFQKYIDSNSSYKKNEYNIDDEIRTEIEEHWKFSIDKWKNLGNRNAKVFSS
jgi:omega-hydroxy-beta-dihydromenaquinone-9 sulfotransferase